MPRTLPRSRSTGLSTATGLDSSRPPVREAHTACPRQLICLALACLALVCLALVTSGCITHAGGGLEPIAPEIGGTQPQLEQAIGAFRVTLAGGAPPSGDSAGQRLGEAILRRWQERGFIAGHSEVSAAGFTGNADLNLTLSGGITERTSALLRVASALTLALVPYTVDTTYDVEIAVEKVETGERFRAAIAARYRRTVELLLVLAAPIATRGEQHTVDAMADHLYEQLRQQGAFDRPLRDTAYAHR